MDAWLSQLEMEASITEQLSTTLLGEDFTYPYSVDINTSLIDGWDVDNIIMQQFTPLPQISHNNNDDNNNNNNDDDNNYSNNSDKIDVQSQQIKEDMNNKQTTRGSAKRKRQPNQVQDHIIAERRRRELLSQMFISLSALVPGLKKIDKTSVLGAAINYIKKLQEKVKTLEEEVAKRTVESLVIIRKPQSVISNDNDNDDNNSATCSSGGCEVDKSTNSYPEIEVRIFDNTLLLKVFYENNEGILIKLFHELDKLGLKVTNCSVVPLGSLALDITIVVQMHRGFSIHVETFVRNLRSALRLPSQ